MIDPRISMGVQVPQASQAIDIYNNALRTNEQLAVSKQQREQSAELFPLTKELTQERINGAGLRNETNQIGIDTNRDNQRLSSMAAFAPTLKTFIESGDQLGALEALQRRKVENQARGVDSVETDAAIDLVINGNMDQLAQHLGTVEREAKARGILNQGASTKSYAPKVDPSTGQSYVQTFNPSTGQAERVDIEGAIQETPTQKNDREVDSVYRTERIKKKVARTSEIKKEMSERNRNAARSGRTIKEALRISQDATQGLGGAAKLQLARLLPGIDAGDEALLDSTLQRLALEQLQNFKGPTTDFEYGVTQSIVGRLIDSKESNLARIKSLERNRWFNEREYEQFKQFGNDGKDPDDFKFNFSEEVQTKKGAYSLQSLQDTAVNYNMTIEEVLERLNAGNN